MTTLRDTATVRDLSDPELYRSGDPEAVWALLRGRTPVRWTEREHAPGYWSVTSHALVSQVLRNAGAYSSEKGMRLDADPAATAASAGKMLIVTDPPRHGAIRRIINSSFTPAMVRRLTDTMRATARVVVAEAVEAGECDLVDVASRLPLSVICDMLGVPKADWNHMLTLTRTAFGTSEAESDPLRRSEAHTEILVYYSELIGRRRRDPGEDIVSALVNGSIDGRPLTDSEVYLNCDGLISGGNETTRHATVGGVLALMAHPAEFDRLRARPELVDSAVEEILRFTSPALHVLRTATRDTELGGRHIREGDRLALWLPSANRDEQVFPDSARFDAGRTPNRHLAFAAGTHFCLGAALAGQELRLLFEEIVRGVRHVEPAGPVRRLRSNLVWGYESVPVRLEGKQ